MPHRKRCKRINRRGHFRYLTFSCFKRQPFLTRDRARQWLVESIIDARRRHGFHLLAWVFMPEHAHILILPQKPPFGTSPILASIKLPVVIHVRNFLVKNAPWFLAQMLDQQPNGKRAFRFWQRGGGYDRNIYSSGELFEKISYIHQNPVRRKLVTRATDWEWSSARDYAGMGPGKLSLDLEALTWVW
jgi:putative transposase